MPPHLPLPAGPGGPPPGPWDRPFQAGPPFDRGGPPPDRIGPGPFAGGGPPPYPPHGGPAFGRDGPMHGGGPPHDGSGWRPSEQPPGGFRDLKREPSAGLGAAAGSATAAAADAGAGGGAPQQAKQPKEPITFEDRVRAVCALLGIGNAAAASQGKPQAQHNAIMAIRNGSAFKENPFADGVEQYLFS